MSYWYPGSAGPSAVPHPADAHLLAPSSPTLPPKMTAADVTAARAAAAKPGPKPWEVDHDAVLRQALAGHGSGGSAPATSHPAPATPAPTTTRDAADQITRHAGDTSTEGKAKIREALGRVVHGEPPVAPRPDTSPTASPTPTATGPAQPTTMGGASRPISTGARDMHGRDAPTHIPKHSKELDEFIGKTQGDTRSIRTGARDMHGRDVNVNIPRHSSELDKLAEELKPRSLKEHWQRIKRDLHDDPVVGRDMYGRDIRRSAADADLRKAQLGLFTLPAPPTTAPSTWPARATTRSRAADNFPQTSLFGGLPDPPIPAQAPAPTPTPAPPPALPAPAPPAPSAPTPTPPPAAPPPAPAPAPAPTLAGPPAGFTPITGSRKGGYHKQKTEGGYTYWYPGDGPEGRTQVHPDEHQSPGHLAFDHARGLEFFHNRHGELRRSPISSETDLRGERQSARFEAVARMDRHRQYLRDQYGLDLPRDGQYLYGSDKRPIGVSTMPPSFLAIEPHPAFRHGAVVYPRALTPEEIQRHELTPLPDASDGALPPPPTPTKPPPDLAPIQALVQQHEAATSAAQTPADLVVAKSLLDQAHATARQVGAPFDYEAHQAHWNRKAQEIRQQAEATLPAPPSPEQDLASARAADHDRFGHWKPSTLQTFRDLVGDPAALPHTVPPEGYASIRDAVRKRQEDLAPYHLLPGHRAETSTIGPFPDLATIHYAFPPPPPQKKPAAPKVPQAHKEMTAAIKAYQQDRDTLPADRRKRDGVLARQGDQHATADEMAQWALQRAQAGEISPTELAAHHRTLKDAHAWVRGRQRIMASDFFTGDIPTPDGAEHALRMAGIAPHKAPKSISEEDWRRWDEWDQRDAVRAGYAAAHRGARRNVQMPAHVPTMYREAFKAGHDLRKWHENLKERLAEPLKKGVLPAPPTRTAA